MKIQEIVVMDRSNSAYISKNGKLEILDASQDDAVLQQLAEQLKKKFKKPVLLNAVDASHYGYVNGNYAYYMPEYLDANARTFTKPYLKPVMLNHSDDVKDVIGQVIKAVPVLYAMNDKDASNLTKPKGHITVFSVIKDQEAIEKIMDGTYITTSIRARGIPEDIKCSICGKNPMMDDECRHYRGEMYDDENGKKTACYYKVGRQIYKEYSFVSIPADEGAINKAHVMIGDKDDGNWEQVDMSKGQELKDLDSHFSIYLGDSEALTSTSVINLKGEDIELKDILAEPKCIGDFCKLSSPGKDSETEQPKQGKTAEVPDTGTSEGDKVAPTSNCPDIINNDYATLSILESLLRNGTMDSVQTVIDELQGVKNFDMAAMTGDHKQSVEKLAELVSDTLDILEDAALSTKKRKTLPASAFCGPNRSFPVPDCAHVTAARRLLGRSNYSASTKASILTCINKKATRMGCNSSDEQTEPVTGQDSAQTIPTNGGKKMTFNFATKDELLSSSIVTAYVDKLEVEHQEKVANLEAKIADLETSVKGNLIDKIADAVVRAKLSKAKEYLEAKDAESKAKALTKMKEEYKDQPIDALKLILSFAEAEAKDKADPVTEMLKDKLKEEPAPAAPSAASENKDTQENKDAAKSAAAEVINNPSTDVKDDGKKDAPKSSILSSITKKRK